VWVDEHAQDEGRAGRSSRIRNGRGSLGERQIDSAVRAGLSQQTWSSVERGADPRVTLETLCRCAMAVDLEPAYR
jgi:transcriptional regulator with XRE-family HTH domain